MDDAYREAASACDVVIFSCSLSPVVVLVSRLFCGRRFERSEGAAHGATDDARATRAARAYTTGGSRRRSRAGAFARCVLFSSSSLLLLSSCPSLRVRRSLAPPAHPRAGVGGAHHVRTRGRTPSATRRARRRAASLREIRFPLLSQFAVRSPGVFLGLLLCCPLPCASAAACATDHTAARAAARVAAHVTFTLHVRRRSPRRSHPRSRLRSRHRACHHPRRVCDDDARADSEPESEQDEESEEGGRGYCLGGAWGHLQVAFCRNCRS